MKQAYQKPLVEILELGESVVVTSGEEQGAGWNSDWSDALNKY